MAQIAYLPFPRKDDFGAGLNNYTCLIPFLTEWLLAVGVLHCYSPLLLRPLFLLPTSFLLLQFLVLTDDLFVSPPFPSEETAVSTKAEPMFYLSSYLTINEMNDFS